ncbi:MAG TPA: peptidoglycan -binding protein [Alphaproteobacteria bacterium]|nr:peptidoglycan -binding protein [Alphaproteobacteria bacterium]
MASSRNRTRRSADIWPGFVDAISTLLLVLIFLLTIFVSSEFLLSKLLSNKDDALEGLNMQIYQLSELLSLEKTENKDLTSTISKLNEKLNNSSITSDLLSMEFSDLKNKNIELNRLLNSLKENTNQIKEENKNLDLKNTNLESELKDLLSTLRATHVNLIKAEKEVKLSEAAKNQVTILNMQIAELREQLNIIQNLLDINLEEIKQKDIHIVELGKKLNTALAVKVGELTQYKSEFFGRLRSILGNRDDIQIVGDRFIFQSEVLFASGSAEVGIEGVVQLTKLSKILLDTTKNIPKDIPWVLQIQGHTDQNPINTLLYPSNWELSAARAISVGKVLISSGVSSDKISVAGFAEFQPLELGQNPSSYRKNRRIEIKLTQP